MPVESAEPQVSSSISRTVSAALTPGVLEEDGATRGLAICTFPENSQGCEAAAAYPTNTGPGDCNSAGKRSGALVQINRQHIQLASASSGADELQGLGVAVYDQDVLEQGVLQQVDQAIQEASQAAAKAEAEKEYQSVLDDVRSVTSSIKQINKIIEQLSPYAAASKDIGRKLESVKRQKENKENQLKKVRAKQKRLQAILGGEDVQRVEAELLAEDDGEEEPGPSTLGSMLMPAQETEWEELIRKGHMTPFGTRVQQKETKKEPRKLMLAEDSAFDQYLADQAKLATERKKLPLLKKKKSSALNPSEKTKGRKNKTASSKDRKLKKRMKKLQITALKAHPKARPKTEPQLHKPRRRRHTEGEETDSEGSEYLPSDEGLDFEQEERDAMEEGFGEDDEEEYELKPYKKKNEGRKKVKRKESEDEYCPGSSGEEEEGRKAKKYKDDGDVEYYRQRIRRWKRQRLREREEKRENGEELTDDSDAEFDEGFKVPGFLWKKLYNYESRARERAWRIGQTQQVTIYRLLTAGTIEEKIYHRQIFKQFLTNRVLKDPKQRRFFKSNDVYELFTLADPTGAQGTETSAIFAGTGSDVSVPKKPERPKSSHYSSCTYKETSRNQNKTGANGVNSRDVPPINNCSTSPSCESTQGRSVDSQSITHNGLDVKTNISVNGLPTGPNNTGDFEETKPLSKNTSLTIYHQHRDTEKRREKRKHCDTTDVHKHKKRKRSRDARFEGHRISHLVKKRTYTKEEREENSSEGQKKSDDYVLARLFRKSGIHSVMQHDTIMESSNPDYVLVEAEANRVAKDALKALKISRQQCRLPYNQPPPPVAKNRFGQKKNSLLSAPSAQSTPTPTKCKDAAIVKKFTSKKPGAGAHFSGEGAGGDLNSTPLSSASLLAKMRARNHIANASSQRAEGEDEEEEESSEAPRASHPPPPPTEHDELLVDLRNFIAFQASVDGQATTQEVLEYFKPRLTQQQAPVFRELLRSICDFHRTSGQEGMWKLKEHFA
ncbi:DNA excision repair protein ERCC-6 [Nematolebias whitei]|uniref:DNA excision repair protein ERCC-6 n=1 Tax=Nematolebias whitei TaxID=451745 RepID=UPI00189AF7A0|nr:DNA excision repair protein ERCC-6 [Nematolebias whitei]